jgi:hypothetical protein
MPRISFKIRIYNVYFLKNITTFLENKTTFLENITTFLLIFYSLKPKED